MSTTLKIKVTKDILERSIGCQGKTQSCAFALAVRDIFPEARVYRGVIAPFEFESWKYTIDELINMNLAFGIPQDMQDYIHAFDFAADPTLLPEQEFTLELPDWVIEKINIDELRPLLVNHPTLQLIG